MEAFVALAAARSILLIGRHDDELARWPWRGRKAKQSTETEGAHIIRWVVASLRPRDLAAAISLA
jgi:hypothetical protein